MPSAHSSRAATPSWRQHAQPRAAPGPHQRPLPATPNAYCAGAMAHLREWTRFVLATQPRLTRPTDVPRHRPQPRWTASPPRPSPSRSTWPMACRASPSWARPTPRSRGARAPCAPRCRTAASASHTTSASPVNLAPADLPKEGGRFDLPIALGVLAANGQIDVAQLARYECAGELAGR